MTHESDRMVPRHLGSLHYAEQRVLREARSLDTRQARAIMALDVATRCFEEDFPPPADKGDLLARAAKIRGACRNAQDALVELASIAGELDALAREL